MQVNKGVFSLFDMEQLPDERTYVVLGRTRGGTTMVAKALQALGIDMGERVNEGNGEDPGLTRPLQKNDVQAVSEWVGRRNGKSPIWGVKSPLMFPMLGELPLRNPAYILVMRDPVAVVSRLMSVRDTEPAKALLATANGYRDLLRYVVSAKRPTLLVSYEKASRHANAFVGALAEFVGQTSQAAITEAALTVAPDNDVYGVE